MEKDPWILFTLQKCSLQNYVTKSLELKNSRFSLIYFKNEVSFTFRVLMVNIFE